MSPAGITIPLLFDQTLGLLDHHFGDLDGRGGRLVEVEAMTTPFTIRCISVTSSGRSSISSTISTTSGWL